jgi:septal ring factor EnvC (AmiA/AmiB activator)
MAAIAEERPPTPAASEGGFKSPVRMLVRFFRRSQQQWKQKALQRRAEIKGLQRKVRDLDSSRAGWKAKAQRLEADRRELEQRLRASEAERTRLQAEVEELGAKKA